MLPTIVFNVHNRGVVVDLDGDVQVGHVLVVFGVVVKMKVFVFAVGVGF